MAVSKSKTLVLTFEQEKETKNKVRFKEDDTTSVGYVYMEKPAFEKLGSPKNLRLTIEAI